MPASNKFSRRALLAAGVVVGAATFAASSRNTAGTVTPVLPAPTGPHQLGTSYLHVIDPNRPDPWKPDHQRELMVTITYPARDVDQHPRASWMTPKLATAVENAASSPQFLNVPIGSVAWQNVRRYAHLDADWHADKQKRPLVLYSPGYASPRELGSVLVDDLASHGYVVASISHTYEEPVEFPGGRLEDAILGSDDQTFQVSIDTRVADTLFVLGELNKCFGRQLDLSRVGVFGHSYGGYTAVKTMLRDNRIRAGIDLDGGLRFAAHTDPAVKRDLARPFLLMGGWFASRMNWRVRPHNHVPGGMDESWTDFWSAQSGWKRDLTLANAAHLSFTDYQSILGQLGQFMSPDSREKYVGSIDPQRSVAGQRAYVRSFFNLHLYGTDDHLLDGPSPLFPEVTFVR